MQAFAQRVTMDREQVVAQLSDLEQKVIKKVESAKGETSPNVVFYGSQMLTAITDFENHVPASGRRSVWESQENELNELSAIVDGFCAQKSAYTDKTTQTINDFTNKYDSGAPIPIPSQPLMVIDGSQQDLSLVFNADMTNATKDVNSIVLTGPNGQVKAQQITDKTITFLLAPTVLQTTSKNHDFAFGQLSIKIPFTKMVGRKRNHAVNIEAEYKLLYSIAPSHAGSIIISSSSSSSNSKTQHKRTRTFLVNSAHENLVEKQCVPKPESGWSLVPESVQLVIESSLGKAKKDWSYRKLTSNGTTCFLVETFYNRSGVSGKLVYHIEYDIKRGETETTVQKDTMDLQWNSNDTVSVASNAEIQYIDYQGSKSTLKKGQHTAGQPIVEYTDRALIIKAPNPVDWVKPLATKD
jgi:hypothetical protein